MKVAAVLISAFAVAGNAAAEESFPEWRITLGAGGVYAPAYEGDDAYRLSIVPNVEVSYGDRFDASFQNGARYRLVNTPALRLGPIGRVKFSRAEDGQQTFAVGGEDTDDLRGLGDVDTSIELGLFAEYEVSNLTLTAEARQAVSGHEGWVADLGARWRGRSEMFGRGVSWSAGPRARFVGDEYNEAYFGVNALQAAASGLAVFDAAGGLHSYGFGASAVTPLTAEGQWALVAIAGYDVLAGDAADSPWSVSVAERSKPRSDSCSADDCEDGALCRRSWTRRGLSHPSHTYESVGVSAPRFLLIARHSKIVVSRAAPANANHAASGRLSRSATKTATRPQMTGIG